MEISNIRGDLTDVSATKEPLAISCCDAAGPAKYAKPSCV